MTELITSGEAPPPAGPYASGLRIDDWIFLSGQGGFDPRTGQLISADIAGQTEQTFRNIEALLQAADASLDDVVSCLVHISDLSQFPGFNATYEKQFPWQKKPVRTTVRADLLAGMLVEVTVIARKAAQRSASRGIDRGLGHDR